MLNRLSLKTHVAWLLCGLVLAFFSATLAAQTSSITLDNWQEDQRTNTFPPDAQTMGGSVQDDIFPGTILGNWRNVFVEAFSGTDATTFRSRPNERNATFNNEEGGSGRIRIFWDGSQRYTIPDSAGNGDENVLDPLNTYLSGGVLTPPAASVQSPGSTDGGSVDPTGLGDIDITTTCPSGDDAGIHMLFGTTDQGEIDVTVDVFSDGSNWSRATAEQDDGVPRVLSFLFTGDPLDNNVFSAMGGAAGEQGADFENVGAIVFTIEVNTPAVDVPYSTPIVIGCGMDFGDAPIRDDEGDVPVRVSYKTLAEFFGRESFYDDLGSIETRTNNFDPETGRFRGPHHAIGGPFLGLLDNDTDAEEDGQPNSTATGDDGDGSDDEQALQSPPTFYADFVVNGEVQPAPEDAALATCAGQTMAPNQWCVALEVSNPTDTDAQVVGWVDFRGSGSFDNLCGDNNTSGVVEYGTINANGTVPTPTTQTYCERSAASVILGNGGFAQTTRPNPDYDPGDPGSAPERLDTAATCGFTGASAGTSFGGGDWVSGNVPPGCEGVVVLVWDLDDLIQREIAEERAILTTDSTFSRFRISTDPFLSGATGCGFFQSTGPTPFCYANDGEVEDHLIQPQTLPVSIASFDSSFTSEGLEVSWTTASETENIGFHIWGESGSDVKLLTEEMVPSTANDIAQPQSYRVVIPNARPGQFDGLTVTAVDTRGREEMYGVFSIGEAHGRSADVDLVDWPSVTEAATERMARMGIEQAGGLLSRGAEGPVLAVDFVVSEPGMQRITYEDLAEAGLDLAGANPFTLAVTLKGEAVPRVVTLPGQARFNIGRFTRGTGSRPPRFGPGSAIEFWGEKPALPDALYVENYVYRVSVDSSRAVEAENYLTRPTESAASQPQTVRVSELVCVPDPRPNWLCRDLGYNPFNANPQPFFTKRLRANSSTDRHSMTLTLDGSADLSAAARVQVRIAGETERAANPDHHVRVQVNGQTVEDFFFNGAVSTLIDAEIPAGVLQPGENTITVIAPGGTSAPDDIMFLGEVDVTYQRQPAAVNDALLVAGLDEEVGAVRVEALSDDTDVVGFGWDGERLFQMAPRASSRGSHTIPTLRNAQAQYWLSTGQALHVPEALRSVGENRLFEQLDQSGPIDFVVIAHPAFMPIGDWETHPLNDYLALRSSEGWNIGLFDILSIQEHFGGGMPLPEAVTEFLRAADERHDFEHVLLIGDGNYDHLDYFGLGAMSFIPTVYRATSQIRHTPSDALLVDLDGSGLPDKAVGRWPVRTLEDLRATVTKTFDWQNNAADIQGALWLTDRQDPKVSSFAAQTGRMASPLIAAGWPEDRIDRVIFEEVGGAANARQIMIDALQEGRAVTGFSGHAAPTMWTWEGLLVPTDVRYIDNRGRPTMIGTMSCYTSYSVSPFTNTIAHRMMNGYMVDGSGNQIPGEANGAVAIHGAATLSSLAQNEIVARRVLENQLEGMTLGEAIEEARLNAWQRGLRDQVINWTLLGDPTLLMNR